MRSAGEEVSLVRKPRQLSKIPSTTNDHIQTAIDDNSGIRGYQPQHDDAHEDSMLTD